MLVEELNCLSPSVLTFDRSCSKWPVREAEFVSEVVELLLDKASILLWLSSSEVELLKDCRAEPIPIGEGLYISNKPVEWFNILLRRLELIGFWNCWINFLDDRFFRDIALLVAVVDIELSKVDCL